MMLHRALRIALVLAACLSIASPAYAYLDPGTGSMLISAVIGVAAALASRSRCSGTAWSGSSAARGRQRTSSADEPERTNATAGVAPSVAPTMSMWQDWKSYPPLPQASAARPQHRLLLGNPPGLASSAAAHRFPGRAAVADGLPRHLRADRRRCPPRPTRRHTFRIRPGPLCTWLFQTLKADVMVLTMLDLQNFHLKRSSTPCTTSTCSTAWAARTWSTTRTPTITTTASSASGPHHVAEIRRREATAAPAGQAPVRPRLSPARAARGPGRRRRRRATAGRAHHGAARADVGRAVDPARLRRAPDRGSAGRRHPRDPAPALPDDAARPAARREPGGPVRIGSAASSTSTAWRRATRCSTPTSRL